MIIRNSINSDFYPMTVVIATLGYDCLCHTIAIVNQSSLVPAEILICIPQENAHRVVKLQNCYQNIKVIITDCRGQVAQRAEGFRSASYNIVMQLDDDLSLDEFCIEYLIQALEKCGAKACISPLLVDILTNQSIYKKPSHGSIVNKIYHWIMNGSSQYQQGKINKAGFAEGVNSRDNNKLYEVEWLPGGCIMHYKQNLVLNNFYPFLGKAYCEDLIHSHLLRVKGVSLFINIQARCWLTIEPPFRVSGLLVFLKDVFADLRARKYFMRISGRNFFRMYVVYMVIFLKYILGRISMFISKR